LLNVIVYSEPPVPHVNIPFTAFTAAEEVSLLYKNPLAFK
jgi:hypothetical protein